MSRNASINALETPFPKQKKKRQTILWYLKQCSHYQFHSSSSVQSVILHDLTSSSMTNLSVVNVISSYISRAAPRAFLCQGPVPPNLASLRLRQRPSITISNCPENKVKRKKNKLTSSQIPPLPILRPKPILQQPPTSNSLLMRIGIQIM